MCLDAFRHVWDLPYCAECGIFSRKSSRYVNMVDCFSFSHGIRLYRTHAHWLWNKIIGKYVLLQRLFLLLKGLLRFYTSACQSHLKVKDHALVTNRPQTQTIISNIKRFPNAGRHTTSRHPSGSQGPWQEGLLRSWIFIALFILQPGGFK